MFEVRKRPEGNVWVSQCLVRVSLVNHERSFSTTLPLHSDYISHHPNLSLSNHCTQLFPVTLLVSVCIYTLFVLWYSLSPCLRSLALWRSGYVLFLDCFVWILNLCLADYDLDYPNKYHSTWIFTFCVCAVTLGVKKGVWRQNQ